jgi:hypothetical protein
MVEGGLVAASLCIDEAELSTCGRLTLVPEAVIVDPVRHDLRVEQEPIGDQPRAGLGFAIALLDGPGRGGLEGDRHARVHACALIKVSTKKAMRKAITSGRCSASLTP